MTFHVITIFPRIFDSYFNESIIKRAKNKKIINIKMYDPRDWTSDKHKTVDDTPYGGGPGMVMKVEPIYKALRALKLKISARGGSAFGGKNKKLKVVLLSAKGKKWNQQIAKRYTKLNNIILICGRYEGIDERVKKFVDEEISIGDYVLTGGEIGTMAIVDSVSRLLPGVLGNAKSLKHESHSMPGLLEYPQYTRPEIFTAPPLIKGLRGIKKYRVPKILLSGNHKKIEGWRRNKQKNQTNKKE